ncbi:hypothetical protein R3P38DRAFT_3612695 [Favolaschia claudopus]|uniref:CxC5 like cysteine cluster associated with KDZ domain-containing protein n=1 Tax=Favolaschia claudopus TaxID=2862362 RepID=A0AAW0A5P4_9AGAR
MSLQQLLAAQTQYPCLSDISFNSLTTFLRMACLARPLIEFQVEDRRRPPDFLHCGLLELLAATVYEQNLDLVQTCWAAFKEIIWNHPEVQPTEEEIKEYNDAALCRGTSFAHLLPPVRVCQDSYCPNYRDSEDIMTLKEPLSHKATMHTLRNGAPPVYSTSLYCRGCHRRYYPNYHVAQHFYIESPLLELFANGMVFGWLSSSNWARIYNIALARTESHVLNNKIVFASQVQSSTRPNPDGWNLDMRAEDVLNGFFLYSLLLEKAERRSILKGRLGPALAERNKAMEGIGQEAYPHACDLLKIQTAHCDGDTIGHRCCKAHDCKTPLASNLQHFCPGHQDRKLKCAVIDCDADSAKNHRTCADPAHRALETAYFTRVPADSMPDITGDNDDDDEVIIEHGRDGPVQVGCDGKPEGGNRRLRAYFGSRRTHNEQLIMRSCGDFAKATFPSPESENAIDPTM